MQNKVNILQAKLVCKNSEFLESAITLKIFTIELQLLPVLFSVLPESQWKDKEEKGIELSIINGY